MKRSTFRAMTDALTSFSRSRFANIAGKTFGTKRDIYVTLGYQRELYISDYRSRYRRNEVANRIVKARPLATWRGGCEIIEDENPETETAFEAAFTDLDKRLKIWDTFRKADILSGIGRYAVILIGAPGEMETPLDSAGPEEIAYLTAYAEDDATVERFDIDRESRRFGLPVFYTIKRTQMTAATATNSVGAGRRVHFSRVIHIAEGLLDDRIYGEPRLECVWNRLDDLEKVAGGGAEAFWRRADGGKQFDIDPTVDVDADDKKNLQTMLEEYEHGFRRYITTRGLKVNDMGSDVADFKSPVESIISLISAGTGIPQRVLMGSEQGKLAAKQDRASWDNSVTDRQNDYAGPCIVRPFVDRLVELGALPEVEYNVRWSSITTMDDEQRGSIATQWATLNDHGDLVVTSDEIRERVLLLAPLTPEQRKTWAEAQKAKTPPQLRPFNKPSGEEDEDDENFPFNQKDAQLADILEAAIAHDKPAVIEHILGIKLNAPAVIQEARSLEAQHPELTASLKAMTEAVTTMANREAPTPVVNVHIDAAPVPEVRVNVEAPQVHVEPPNVHVNVTGGSKRVERDPKTNLVTRVIEEN